jgi:hypothetical protein
MVRAAADGASTTFRQLEVDEVCWLPLQLPRLGLL